MSEFELVNLYPNQWYVRRAGDLTNQPVALFYDLELAKRFVDACSFDMTIEQVATEQS